VGKARKKHVFGNKIDKQGDIHFSSVKRVNKIKINQRQVNHNIHHNLPNIKKTYELSLLKVGEEVNYLQDILAQSDNGKPWVFFLHGNNQTLSKNLVKSRRIQDEYDVNMVIFSWPSCSYQPHFLPMLFLGGALMLSPPSNKIGKWIAKKAFKRKIKQYKIARKMAEKTALHFGGAFKLIKDNLLLPMKESHNPHTCFLVHSLGGMVLRKVVEGEGNYLDGYRFSTCMLHQTDELDKYHREWATAIPFVDNEKTHITRNVKDLILLMSGVVNNNLDATKAFTRLGNRWSHDSEAGSPLNYIDVTGLDDLGLVGHGIAWDKGRSAEVDALCRPVLTGVVLGPCRTHYRQEHPLWIKTTTSYPGNADPNLGVV
jgi:hypothetical protein